MPNKIKRFNEELQFPHKPVVLPNNPNTVFFLRTLQHEKTNWLVAGSGPDYVEQSSAILENRAWSVLNASILGNTYTQQDEILLRSVNALKVSLQTYGLLPPGYTLTNQKNANNEVFHTNVRGKHVTYEVEWALVDREKRILALVGFKTHENYKFNLKPLTEAQKKQYLNDPKNITTLKQDTFARAALCQKAKRVSACPLTEKEQKMLVTLSKRSQP